MRYSSSITCRCGDFVHDKVHTLVRRCRLCASLLTRNFLFLLAMAFGCLNNFVDRFLPSLFLRNNTEVSKALITMRDSDSSTERNRRAELRVHSGGEESGRL